MHVGEAMVPAGVAIREPLVIEAEQVEDRGVEVVDVHRVLDRGEAGFVGRAVHVSAADAATRQPHAEAIVVVVSTREGR